MAFDFLYRLIGKRRSFVGSELSALGDSAKDDYVNFERLCQALSDSPRHRSNNLDKESQLNNGLMHSAWSNVKNLLGKQGPYTYTPLEADNSMRLIVLLPGTRDSPVEIEFQQVDPDSIRSSKPCYEALSYTWGTDCSSKVVHVGGKLLPVRDNLHAALVSLRSECYSRTLWVDALCINQNDCLERNKQVAIMDTIYKEAEEVIVWLGEIRADLTLEAHYFDLIQWIHTLEYQDSGEYDRSFEGWRHSFTPMKYHSGIGQAIVDLCSRKYWSRVWVIQEFILAKNVSIRLDNYHLRLESFQRALNSLRVDDNDLHFKLMQGMATQLLLERASHELRNFSNLRDLICITHDSECTDPRDKIFGVLALARFKARLVVDYRMSTLDLYAVAFYSDSKSAKSAARAVYWSQFLQRILRIHDTPSTDVATRDDVGKNVIIVIGTLRSQIKCVEYVRSAGDLAIFIASNRLICSQPVLDDLVMMAEHDKSRLVSLCHSRILCKPGWDLYSRSTRNYSLGNRNSENPRRWEQSSELRMWLRSFAVNSRNGYAIFITEDGQCGLAPSSILPGDFICQFQDSDVTSFVRRAPIFSHLEAYALVGGGLMYCPPEHRSLHMRLAVSSSYEFAYYCPRASELDPRTLPTVRFEMPLGALQQLTKPGRVLEEHPVYQGVGHRERGAVSAGQ